MPSPAPRPSAGRSVLSDEEGVSPGRETVATSKNRAGPAKKTVPKTKKVAVATGKSKGSKAPSTAREGSEAARPTPTVSDAATAPAAVATPEPVDRDSVTSAPELSGGERSPTVPSRPRSDKKKAAVVLLGIALLAAIGASALLWIIRRDQRQAILSAQTQRAGSEADTLQTSKQAETKSPKGAIDPFVVGQYTCFERLGEGGMGMVYKARHTELGREAAVKVLSPSAMVAPDAIELFEREAKLSSQINHPNSVFIYDHGNVGGALFYLVMEFIDGQSLDEIISPKGKSPRPLPVHRVLTLTRQICSVLDTAHAQGIVHRDLR